MPNILDENGLEIKTATELSDYLKAQFRLIYGADINLDSDSPDGQMIGIFTQVIVDNLELINQVYNSMNPDNAIGVTLDQRVALNGIQRQGGTFSKTNVTVVTSKALTLYGLDQEVNPVYTVSDDEGNEWQLEETYIFSGADTQALSFSSSVSGQVLTSPNTITTPVSIILGVLSVNNPDVQTVIGQDEETDEELRLRRQRSTSIVSQGYLSSLLASLENISGITDAFVLENNTDATDADGIPSHSIWVIVSGSYDDIDVANAIYRKRNAGCGMKGTNEYTITQVDGTPFVVSWDDVEVVEVFIEMTLESLDGVTAPNSTAIAEQLPNLYIPSVYEKLNVNKLSSYVQQIDPNALVTSAGFSLLVSGPFTSTLLPSTKDKQFALTTANIDITVV